MFSTVSEMCGIMPLNLAFPLPNGDYMHKLIDSTLCCKSAVHIGDFMWLHCAIDKK